MLIRRDALAEVPRLVHAPHAFHEEAVHAQALPGGDPRLVEGVEEVEHPVADEEHRVDDLLRLLGHELKEPLAREEAGSHGRLAEARLARHELRRLRDLGLGERAVAVEHLAEPLAVSVRRRADHVAAIEEDGAARVPVEHEELARPPRLTDEPEHVAERAVRRDLARETEDRAVLGIAPAVVADVAHHDEVRGPWHQAERALARAHPLARRLAHRVSGPRAVDPHELQELFVHPAKCIHKQGACVSAPWCARRRS